MEHGSANYGISQASTNAGTAENGHHDVTRQPQHVSYDWERDTIMQQQASHSAAVLPEETPSRYELISIVRKHSTFLKNLDTDDANKGYNNALDMRFWRELVDMFFVRGMINSKDRPDDDLVFFVHHLSPKEQTDLQPYFVRRWCSQLEKVIGDNADEVDWHRSFYLNLIAHTTYTLTVAICKREALQNRQKTVNSAIAPVYQISKTVYASPSRVNFQTNMSKGFETVPAYPDICFTIDDYDDTFEEVVLVEPDHCYCVFLNADGGAAFCTKDLEGGVANRISPETYLLGDPQSSGNTKLTLFSGFVSYDMVRSAFEGGRSKIRGFLVAASSARSERLIMHGPGGRGEVEVSVSGLPDESVQPFSSSLWGSTHGTRIGSIVRKAAITALLAAKQPYVHSSSVRNDVGSLPLRCCLMSLSLPWDALAHDLLFKDLPNDS
ncbi:hypothetical protein KP509_30G008100 [Ceratopteris richardii]|uniref:Uncharacterized protein n=1 Tax=Ceratopteris richardii TaxID=49495 RepID=A0A8T2R141_CERRI|nr:hypothetical protein KP509_30G008100 [Ceratopteris richardii]KAH7289544.1 hypothetical protein KP509_30G008100 [Ceratopteris richardii]